MTPAIIISAEERADLVPPTPWSRRGNLRAVARQRARCAVTAAIGEISAYGARRMARGLCPLHRNP
jgi:hypothetical protein